MELDSPHDYIYAAVDASVLETLWSRFNDIAEGFAVSPAELRAICDIPSMYVTKLEIDALFRALDTDNNGLVDGLEVLAVAAMASGLNEGATARYIFRLFDFDESGELSLDEMTLALKSVLTGSAKLTGELPPEDQELEQISQLAFLRCDKDADHRITVGEFVDFCLENPEARSWLEYYDDPDQEETGVAGAAAAGATAGSGAAGKLPLGGGAAVSVDPESEYELSKEARHMQVANARGAAFEAARRPALRATVAEAVRRRAAGAEAPPPPADGPWRDSVQSLIPSSPAEADEGLPDAALQLEYVHGYRGNDCRDNVKVAGDGRIVFPAAGVVVIYDAETRSYEYFLEHEDDVVSLAAHPNGDLFASGEVGKAPKIFVWDAMGNSKKKMGGRSGTGAGESKEPEAASGAGSSSALGATGGSARDGRGGHSSGPDVEDGEMPDNDVDAVACLHGFHTRGVSYLAFSPSGKLLASVGQDDDHSVCVYDWARGEVHHSGKGSVRPVYAAAFRDENTLVTGGKNHIYFWDMASKTKKKGIFGRAPGVRMQTVASIQPFGDPAEGLLATGMASGHVYVWKDRNCLRAIRAHDRAVACLHGMPSGLATGGSDGTVRLWTAGLEPKATLDITACGGYDCAVRAVEWLPDSGTVVVGTKGCEIFEVRDTDGRDARGGPVIQGHCQKEVWGLATHPERGEYVTVGDDGTMRVWDSASRQLVRIARLGHPSRAVCYSPEGDFIAVGLGSGRKHSDPTSEAGQAHAQKEGSFLVVRSADLAVVHAARDATEWITQCKFSPDGRTLAVGSRDSKVYLYNTEDFSLRAVCTRNSSFVTHIDFSSTGDYIQCTDGAHELLFYHAEDGKQEASSATMKDVKWATQTCTLGWAVQGVWPPYADGTDVNALDRARGGDVVAAADDFGRVTLRRFPALLPSAIATESLGHSSHVTNVRFTAGDRHLISVGGNDKSVFQWRVYGDTGPGVDAPPEEHAVPFEPPEESAAAAGAGGRKGRTATRRALDGEDIDSEDEEDLVDGEELGQSDEARAAKSDDAEARMRIKEAAEAAAAGTPGGMAALTVDLRPWMGTLVKPSAPPGSDPELPDCNPRLEWVHGYAGRGFRGNVHYTSEREAVWFAAAVAVVMDPRRWSQRFFTGHTDDVCSIARHPDGIHFATGQLGAEPYVCVWRADTLEEVSRLKGAHERGVCQLAFSGDGKRLASVGLDDNHSFVVWDWRAGSPVYSGPGSKRKTLGVALSEDGRRLLQAGVKTIVVHGQQGRNAVSRRVRLGRLGSLQTFLCAQIHAPDGPDGEEVGLVGTADGHVYVVDLGRRVLAGAVSAHSGSVCSIATGGPRGCVLTGGKDGAIKKWSARMEPDEFRGGPGSDAGKGGHSGGGSTDAISLEVQGSAGKSARAVAWSQCGTRILAGSSGCEVFEFTAESGANPHEAPLVHSHCKHELWGLATHPTQGEFVTSGDDGMIRIWDIAEKACKAVLSIGGMARAVAMSPDGNAIAVGMGGRVGAGRSRDDGTVQLLALDRQSDGTIGGKVLARRRDSREWIQDIKFSPDGRTIAAASHDNKVYLYSASEQGMPLRAVFDRHHSFITHIDFSKDSRRIQSTCGAHELLFSDAQTGAHIPSAAAVKDIEWATQTCTLGWAVQGVWPPYADGTDVNALDRARGGDVVAAADDFGRVTLRRFPALDPEASCKQLLGHSSHVTNVRFAAGDSHLISVGGGDRCVFQWRLEDDREAAKQLRESVFAGQEAVDEDAELPIEVYRKDMTQAMRGQAPLPSAADGEEVTGELGAALDGAALAQLTSGATSGADGSLGGGARGGGTGRAVDAPAAPVTTSTEGVRVRAASAVVALGVKENASVPAGAIATATMDQSKRTAMGVVGGGGPGGGSFGSTPAFRGALVPPTHPPTAVDAPPKPELRLEWAYGIRARDARGACGYNSTGALVYATAALGVVYDHAKHTQVFYTGHDDDVVSLAVDPSGRFAATGQLGYRPRVHVWDAHSGAGLCVLPVVHGSAVTRLSFSADGKSLFSADDGEPYTVAMYSTGSGAWTDGALRAQGTGERKRCFFVQALPGADSSAPSAAGSDEEFVAATGGKNHVRFWRREGRTLECVRGLFGSKGRIQSVLSAAVVRGSLVTGTASGHLYRWKGRVVENATPTSDGGNKLRSVYWIDARGAAVVLGLRDGTVRVFDADLKPHDTIKLDDAQEKSMDSAVHAVQLRSDGEVLLAVTRGSEIYEVALATGTVTLRAEGHSADELWGLAAHPSAPELALTAGDDGSVRLWDLRTHRAARKAVLEGMARTVSWSPDGTVVAVGLGGRIGGRNTRWKTLAPATTGGGAGMSRQEAASAAGASGSSAGRDGVFSLLRADTLEAVHEARDTTRPLTALKFSASGQLLVAGSRDGKVYVYDARGGRFALSRTLSRHVSAVTHVDVSIDGSLVRSQSTSYELLFGRTDQEGEVGRAEEVRDTAWHTETLPIGWAQMGVWPPSADGTDINAVDRSRSGQLLASADDFGGVKLYRYPACPPGTEGGRWRQAYFKRYHGHASHVTCARFTAGDKYLLTTGGADRTLLQWRVIGNDSMLY